MTTFNFESGRYPLAPGCYLMKDDGGRVIYVGKSKVLRRRLASYFQRRQDRPRRTRQMVERVADVEVILVNNELESLVLENNLIKRYRPRFNRRLMDEESGYHYIVLTDEEVPRLIAYRKRRWNKELTGARVAHRFGPYLSRRYRDELLDYLVSSFGLRSCSSLPERACLRHEFGWCCGICTGAVTPEAYAAAVAGAVEVLRSPHRDLVARLRAEVVRHAEALAFERAARAKRTLEALSATLKPQIVERDAKVDQGILCCSAYDHLLLHIRRGALVALSYAPLMGAGTPGARAAAVADFVRAARRDHPMDELLVEGLNDAALTALTAELGMDLRIRRPRAVVEYRLIALAERNRRYRAERHL